MTAPTANPILTDSEWVTLLRRSYTSDFGDDGRGEMEELIEYSSQLAVQDGSPAGVTATMAANWLKEYRYQVDELGYVSGPTCERIADACERIVTAHQSTIVASVERPVDEPLDDAEWMLLLRGATGELGAPADGELRAGVNCLIEGGQRPHDLDVDALFYAASDYRTRHQTWRPGPLLTRALANLPVASLSVYTIADSLNPLRELAGLPPLPADTDRRSRG